MNKRFNTTGVCAPDKHYMVNLEGRLSEIKKMIDEGLYFTINRARQYGKTTTLHALRTYLRDEYVVVSMDFQMLSHSCFRSEHAFVRAFSREFAMVTQSNLLLNNKLKEHIQDFISDQRTDKDLSDLFFMLSNLCAYSDKPVVLLIDEVDSASNNEVFLDFLAQLRGYYLHRTERPTFHSVILTGVYDIKNLRRKIRSDENHKLNSPWNIAADFNIDMSFSAEEIAVMLEEYEDGHKTGMNIPKISSEIYEYTSGYPFLVSRICKIMDEILPDSAEFQSIETVWTHRGLQKAVNLLLAEKNTLFESLMNKMDDYPELCNLLYVLLFEGKTIPFNPDEPSMDMAVMFGFIRNNNGAVAIANRIFETRLYNRFLSASEVQATDIYHAALQDKNQFIQHGRLNMELVLEKFVRHFTDIYGDCTDRFIESDGRRIFLMYLRPIINGTGNYYIEAQTRDLERTDVIVDYLGEQFVVELKIWRGNSYHERGEQQLADYLEYYHLKKGYMLSFNFNKSKQPGMKRNWVGDKLLVEAVV